MQPRPLPAAVALKDTICNDDRLRGFYLKAGPANERPAVWGWGSL